MKATLVSKEKEKAIFTIKFNLGVAQDESKARSIYRSACFSGDTSGCDNLKRMGRKR